MYVLTLRCMHAEDDMRAMAEALLFPDAVLVFDMSVEIAERRLLPGKLHMYRHHRGRVERQRKEKQDMKDAALRRHREAFDKDQAAKVLFLSSSFSLFAFYYTIPAISFSLFVCFLTTRAEGGVACRATAAARPRRGR